MKKTTTAKNKNASPSKETKLPNINLKSKSPTKANPSPKATKTEISQGKANSKVSNNTSVAKTSVNADTKENKEAMAKKMEDLKERKKKRLEKEKKEEERDKKIYEEVLKEFQENKGRTNTETNISKLSKTKNKKDLDNSVNDLNNIKLPQIKISEKKTQAILEESGMLDAYKYLIVQLCKNGFPTGNLFEYSAYVIKNYEKKWKEKKSKMNKEKVEKYWQEKKEEIDNFEKNKKKGNDKKNKKDLMQEDKIKALNRSFEERSEEHTSELQSR